MIFEWKSNVENVKGIVKVTIPKYVERMNLLKEINLKTLQNGEVQISSDQIDMMIKIKEVVQSKIVSVDLEINKKKITNFDDLEYYSEFNLILNDLSSAIFNGIKLGN